MTEQTDGERNDEKPKKLRLPVGPKPITVSLPDAGEVLAGSLTVKGDVELRRRVPDVEAVSASDLVRSYIAVVCRVPDARLDGEPNSLDESQVSALSARDLESFSAAYLQSAHRDGIGPEEGTLAVDRLAADIRERRKRSDQLNKEMREKIANIASGRTIDLIRQASSTSDLLKGAGGRWWSDGLGSTLSGIRSPLDELRRYVQESPYEQFRESLKGGAYEEIQRQLRDSPYEQLKRNLQGGSAHEEMQRHLQGPLGLENPAIRGSDTVSESDRQDSRILHVPERLTLPDFDPDSTPVGRTANAAERLEEVARSVEDVVSKAGAHLATLSEMAVSFSIDVANQRKNDAEHIATNLDIANRNLRFAKWSLVGALVLGVVSVALAGVSLWVDIRTWRDDEVGGVQAGKAAEEQIEALRAMRDEIREERLFRSRSLRETVPPWRAVGDIQSTGATNQEGASERTPDQQR